MTNNYSLANVQDELWFELFDELDNAQELSQAPAIIDRVYSKFIASHNLLTVDQKVIEAQVKQIKDRYKC